MPIPPAPARISLALVTLFTLTMWGCASQPRPQTNVLVPAEGTRPATLVPLPSDWAAATVRALRASPGCTGVELAGTTSGKQSIFAMFKDKAALATWYRSEAHQQLLGKVVFYREGKGDFTPAAGVEGDGPILVIATMTPVPQSETVPPRTVLLSIELFRPTAGGVRFGGASFITQ